MINNINWKYKDFDDYLQEIHMKENPTILDDDLPDAFSDWLCDLDPQSIIDYAEKYASIKVVEEPKKIELSKTFDYSNRSGVIGWVSGTIKSFNNGILNPMETIRDIELTLKEYTRLQEEELAELKRNVGIA